MGRSASLTLAVAHTVRDDSVLDVRATSLLSAVAQTKAEVGVLAEAGGVRLAVDRGAAQVSLLIKHVLNAVSLDDVFSTRSVTDRQDKGKGLTPHSGTELMSWAYTAPSRALTRMAAVFILTDGCGVGMVCWLVDSGCGMRLTNVDVRQ